MKSPVGPILFEPSIVSVVPVVVVVVVEVVLSVDYREVIFLPIKVLCLSLSLSLSLSLFLVDVELSLSAVRPSCHTIKRLLNTCKGRKQQCSGQAGTRSAATTRITCAPHRGRSNLSAPARSAASSMLYALSIKSAILFGAFYPSFLLHRNLSFQEAKYDVRFSVASRFPVVVVVVSSRASRQFSYQRPPSLLLSLPV